MTHGVARLKQGAPRQRRKHQVEPVPGEQGRYYVDSFSDPEGRYIVDTPSTEDTNVGKIIGTCPCVGWSIRKLCSHLDDAREYAENPRAYERARKREAAAALPRRPRAVRRRR